MLDPSSVPVLGTLVITLRARPSAAHIRRLHTRACLHDKCFGRSHPLTAGIDLINSHLNWNGAAE